MFKFFNKNNEKLADKMFKKNEKQLMDELGEILYISGVHPMDFTDDELISIQKSLNKAGIETMNKMKVTNRQTGNIFNVKVNPYLLSKAYQAIEKNNPLGYIIRRNK